MEYTKRQLEVEFEALGEDFKTNWLGIELGEAKGSTSLDSLRFYINMGDSKGKLMRVIFFSHFRNLNDFNELTLEERLMSAKRMVDRFGELQNQLNNNQSKNNTNYG